MLFRNLMHLPYLPHPNNDIENEIKESIKQVKKIAFFRLNEIIDE